MLKQLHGTRRRVTAEAHWPIRKAALRRRCETQNGDIGVTVVCRDTLKGAFHYFPTALQNLGETSSGEQQGPGEIVLFVAPAGRRHDGAEFTLQARFSYGIGHKLSNRLATAIDKPVKRPWCGCLSHGAWHSRSVLEIVLSGAA
jgi:hypothetical protein